MVNLATLGRIGKLLMHQHRRYAQHATRLTQQQQAAIGGVLKEQLQGVHPVNARVQTGLILPEMKVEISAMAVRREAG